MLSLSAVQLRYCTVLHQVTVEHGADDASIYLYIVSYGTGTEVQFYYYGGCRLALEFNMVFLGALTQRPKPALSKD